MCSWQRKKVANGTAQPCLRNPSLEVALVPSTHSPFENKLHAWKRGGLELGPRWEALCLQNSVPWGPGGTDFCSPLMLKPFWGWG